MKKNFLVFALICMSPLSCQLGCHLHAKCNNHHEIDAIIIFPYLKVKMRQCNVKPFEIQSCVIKNSCLTYFPLNGTSDLLCDSMSILKILKLVLAEGNNNFMFDVKINISRGPPNTKNFCEKLLRNPTFHVKMIESQNF